MGSSKANKVLVNFEKKVGIGSDPRPPPWAKFPTFTKNLFWELPYIGRTIDFYPEIWECLGCVMEMSVTSENLGKIRDDLTSLSNLWKVTACPHVWYDANIHRQRCCQCCKEWQSVRPHVWEYNWTPNCRVSFFLIRERLRLTLFQFYNSFLLCRLIQFLLTIFHSTNSFHESKIHHKRPQYSLKTLY